MTRVRIANGKGIIGLGESGILRLDWTGGEIIGADDACAAIAAVNKMCRGKSRPLLVNVRDVSLTRAARIAFTSPSGASRIALLGSSPVDRVIASFFLRLQATPCPTRYFTSITEALTWLASASSPTAPASGSSAAASGKPRPKPSRAAAAHERQPMHGDVPSNSARDQPPGPGNTKNRPSRS